MAKNDRKFGAMLRSAHEAGMAAGNASTPVPMIVGDAVNILSDQIDYSRPTYFVEGGVCGFAWVSIKGNTSFGRWAAQNANSGFRKDSYAGGLRRSCHEFGQSMQRKEAYAMAFAKVLRDNGIDAHMGSRMD